MKKRILTVLLAVCLVFALGTVSALADLSADCAGGDSCNHEAAIGTTHYDKLSEAIAAANNSKETTVTVTLLKDVSVTLQSNSNTTGAYNITKSGVTIDGGSNSYKITATAGTASGSNYQHIFIIQANNVTISNLEIDGSDIARSGIQAYGNVENLTLSNVTSSNNYGYGVLVNNGASVIANNLDAHENGWGGVNVEAQNTESKFTMNGGNLTNNGAENVISVVLDSDQGGTNTVVLNGGTYNTVMTNTPDGSTPRSEGTNKITISDANVTTLSLNGSGTDKVTVDDGSTIGTISSTNSNNTKPVVTVNDSTVTNPINIENDITFIANNSYVGGQHQNDAEAKVGDQYFDTLQAAIDAADADDKVELLKHVALNTGLTISENITIDGRDYDLTISGVTGNGIEITSGHTLTLANTDLKITGKTSTAGKFDGTGIYAVGNLTLRNSNVVLEDLNKAIIANAGSNEIKLEDSTLTIDDIDGNASNGGKWTVDDSTVNISDVGNYGLSVYSLKTTGDSELSFENIGYGAIFAELSIDIGGTTSVKIDNAGSDNKDNTIIFESPYGDCYAPIQLVVDKKGLPTSGREITFGSGTSISVVDSFDHNGDVYVDEGTKYVNNSGDYLSVKIVDGDVFMVTFVDDDDDFLFSYTVDKNDDITLPGRPYYSAREFIGWLCDEDHEIYEAGDKYKDVDENLEFKAVWETAAYDIVIDDDILHGDIWTSPNSEAEAGDTVHVYADPDAGYVLEDLSVTYRSGRNELKLTRVSANHYTFTMPARDVYVTAEFTSDGFPFDDVRSNQWFYDAVYYVWANDLMEGVDYDEFNPNGTMTRAMFWAVLGRIDGETITGSDWADEARDWAMSEGVSDGTDPNGLVTREQMVTMLWRYAGERDGSGSLSRYTDGDKVAQYATEAMRWALGNGIIEGTTATTLEPQATATRAQCAAIFMRYYE